MSNVMICARGTQSLKRQRNRVRGRRRGLLGFKVLPSSSVCPVD